MASLPTPPSDREMRHVAAWLSANGIDPGDVPVDAAITVDRDSITCEVFKRGEDGGIAASGDEAIRSTTTVPLQVPLSDLQCALADDAAPEGTND